MFVLAPVVEHWNLVLNDLDSNPSIFLIDFSFEKLELSEQLCSQNIFTERDIPAKL